MPYSDTIKSAYKVLEEAKLKYHNRPVGYAASNDPDAPAANYSECFVRDFIPPAIICLLDGEYDIVRNFLQAVLILRDKQEAMEGHKQLPKVMPASFKVTVDDNGKEHMEADFGDRAIGRVAPVDSMMWWIILLHLYVKVTGDNDFSKSTSCQNAIRMIMNICLRDRFEVFPTLLVPDGSFMIDRRMGVFGHPLEIQALFFAALKTAQSLLINEDANNHPVIEQSTKRLKQLTDYVQDYYWMDLSRLNEIHRYETELFGHGVINKLNIYPDSIPDWVSDWIPDDAGYFVGNLGPGKMDFRFYALGNLLSMIFGLSNNNHSQKILRLFEQRWDDLIGTMPVKILYPAMQGLEWHLLTGSDPKNVRWSYHNGGNWPVLLWPFVAACVKVGNIELAKKAFDVAAFRLNRDEWPEYYDGKSGKLIGRKANFNQTWSAAALILSEKFIKNPETVDIFSFDNP